MFICLSVYLFLNSPETPIPVELKFCGKIPINLLGKISRSANIFNAKVENMVSTKKEVGSRILDLKSKQIDRLCDSLTI